ncbi:uncharacterized protein LAESUDRAFT_244459 [Laetiporus sulphureus 93-53]|uniref:Uncharacterized protein n=1 Tax=Laetiporus sulphureus 93-53 TaxID=1314785 RepID=A0A165DH38_9APHY|nr:uncharacterized protein LAESUDRAFT_244459 [Laetiporus sulphureus 93-53]KZT04864.1 hypothetical protein LAESUDRAFT_244459 [Laetiporus sulphureus 93-53]
MLHVVWRNTRPAAFDFYDFGRTLFDAAVVCAHAVIQQPTTLLAMEAMKSVSSSLEVMKELGASRVGVEGVRGEGNRSDAIKIVEMMKRKAEAARGYRVGSTLAGTKRKREPLDDDRMQSGFHLPFVGASVSSVKADPPRSSPSKSLGGFAKDMFTVDGRPKGDIKKLARDKEKDKDKAAKPAPIRARPSGTPSTSRPRTASVSSNAPSIAASIRRMESATPGVVPAPPAAHSQPLPPPPPLPSASPRIAAYDAYSSLPPQTPVHEHMQQEEYPMQYNSGDDSSMDRRRFSSQSFGDSPQGAPMYDQTMREASLSHPSPASASYSTGPATPHYYQYAPPPGPPPAGPQPGYDSTTVGHHNVPPMAALTHPAHVEQQQQGGAPVPMTSMTDSQYMSYEKTHPAPPYGPHVRATDQTRPLAQAHDYQPQAHPRPHQLHIPGSQTWLQPDPNAHADLWGDYKYMS